MGSDLDSRFGTPLVFRSETRPMLTETGFPSAGCDHPSHQEQQIDRSLFAFAVS